MGVFPGAPYPTLRAPASVAEAQAPVSAAPEERGPGELVPQAEDPAASVAAIPEKVIRAQPK
jgi:hypothetical protein